MVRYPTEGTGAATPGARRNTNARSRPQGTLHRTGRSISCFGAGWREYGSVMLDVEAGDSLTAVVNVDAGR